MKTTLEQFAHDLLQQGADERKEFLEIFARFTRVSAHGGGYVDGDGGIFAETILGGAEEAPRKPTIRPTDADLEDELRAVKDSLADLYSDYQDLLRRVEEPPAPAAPAAPPAPDGEHL